METKNRNFLEIFLLRIKWFFQGIVFGVTNVFQRHFMKFIVLYIVVTPIALVSLYNNWSRFTGQWDFTMRGIGELWKVSYGTAMSIVFVLIWYHVLQHIRTRQGKGWYTHPKWQLFFAAVMALTIVLTTATAFITAVELQDHNVQISGWASTVWVRLIDLYNVVPLGWTIIVATLLTSLWVLLMIQHLVLYIAHWYKSQRE